MRRDFPQMRKLIPESERVEGKPYIVHAVVDEAASRRTSLGGWLGYTPPGHYCMLKVGNGANESWDTLWMSDTPLEHSENSVFLREAAGDVLLAGLGIGMLAVALCRKREVRSVTVLEINGDIIRLVAPHIQHRKLRIIQADANNPPLAGRNFDAIWLDIWANICSDNWTEMKPMLAEYRKLRRKGGIVSGWMKSYVQQESRNNGW